MRTKTEMKSGNNQDMILLLHIFGVKHVYTDLQEEISQVLTPSTPQND